MVIVIGGYTRLTNSGLSIVTWKPVSGVIPPLSADQWQAEFDNYQKFPEFKFVNSDITLDGFKRIFWVEFIHRMAGRLVGLVFLLPFVFFLIRGYIGKALGIRLGIVFILGGLQGLLGWYMVKSGLINDPSVSQYRLTAHLSLAVLLYGYLLWLVIRLIRDQRNPLIQTSALARCIAAVCIGLVALMQISGGFMAGTHAGFVINTFPDMNGEFIPEGIAVLSPAWRNLFENVIMIQFFHRWMAVITFLAFLALWQFRLRRDHSGMKFMFDIVLAIAVVQVVLGISTLISRVAIPVAITHQTGFVVLLSALIVLFGLMSPKQVQ